MMNTMSQNPDEGWSIKSGVLLPLDGEQARLEIKDNEDGTFSARPFQMGGAVETADTEEQAIKQVVERVRAYLKGV